MKIDKCAEFIISTLLENDFEAYVVGGSVRDVLLDIQPKDWEICTNASIGQIKDIFKKLGVGSIETSKSGGTIGLVMSGIMLDVINGNWEKISYKEISEPIIYNISLFNGKIEDDLSQRDFTMNAIAYNHLVGLIDPYNGFEDIENKTIRCVGEPIKNFKLDSYRLLRALIFKGRFNFSIENNTKEAIDELAYLVEDIGPIRKQSALVEILRSQYNYNVLMEFRNVIAYIIPEIQDSFDFNQNNPHHQHDLYKHLVKTVEVLRLQSEFDPALLIAGFLHDIGKPCVEIRDEAGISHYPYHTHMGACMISHRLSALRVDECEALKIYNLVKYHDTYFESVSSLRKFVMKHGKEFTEDLFKLRFADIVCQGNYQSSEKIRKIVQSRQWLVQIGQATAKFGLCDLEIDGRDLIKMGLKPGPIFRSILEDILDKVESGSLENESAKLRRYVKYHYINNVTL